MLLPRFLGWITLALGVVVGRDITSVTSAPDTSAHDCHGLSMLMVDEIRQTDCYTSLLQESMGVYLAASSHFAKIASNASRPGGSSAAMAQAPRPPTQQHDGGSGGKTPSLLQLVGICAILLAMLTFCLVGLCEAQASADSHVQAKAERTVPPLSGLASLPRVHRPSPQTTPRGTSGQSCRRFSAPAFPGYESIESSDPVDVHIVEDQELDEDVYGLVIATLCRDMHRLAQDVGYDTMALRVTRALISMSLLLFNIGLQLFLLYQIKYWVTDKAVIDIRAIYNDYQFHMYGNDESHVRHTAGGVRGMAAYFDVSNFATLDNDLKSQVCFIPFAQPCFLGSILFIWTLTCAAEIKTGLNKANTFLRQLPTIPSMRKVFAEASEDDPNLRVIVGLTKEIKILLLFGVVIPRLFLTAWLIYLGSRWLVATPSYSDILLNTVALEFILLLKDLLYSVTAPARNKHDLRNTRIDKHVPQEAAGFYAFLGTFMWFPICFAWVLLYIYYFQRVLPEYNWDVRGPCHDYIAAEHAF